MGEISFGAHIFVVIDAVPETELQTGKQIYRAIQDSLSQGEKVFSCKIHRCESSNELFDILEKVLSDTKETGSVPLIHLDGHGSSDYFVLPDQSRVSWNDIFSVFRNINIATKNNLFFTSGACYSAFAYKAASILEKCPVFGLLCPAKTVPAGEIMDGYVVFYKSLIGSGGLKQAFIDFAEVTTPLNYSIIFSQRLFENAAYNYITQECMGRGKQKRIEGLLTKAKKESALSTRQARTAIKKDLKKSQAPALTKFYKIFMMIDLYPENKNRYNFNARKFEKCVRDGKYNYRAT